MNRHASPLSRGNSMIRALRLNPLMACLALVPCAETMAAVTHVVDQCTDSVALFACDGQDDGTLRKSITCADNGDTIDLSQLQCSTITLSGALTPQAASLTLVGPSSGTLTLDAAGQSRVLQHHGGADDTLYVNHLTLANGHYDKPFALGGGTGGCIYSSGNVVLNFSTVTSCYASAANADALGGAIYAIHAVNLYRSTVSGSTAQGNGPAPSVGGGIYAGAIDLNQSTVSGNTAASANSISFGGGVAAGLIHAKSSTVSRNKADRDAGIDGNHVDLTDSTVSGNQTFAGGRIGGVYARQDVRIIGSTIAGNTSDDGYAAGLFLSVAVLSEIESSIIAGNKAGGVELDVGSAHVQPIPGHNNLIMALQAGTNVPADTLTSDPLLGPLQDNGGPTQTHALLPGSPAIDHGSNSGGPFDQRGRPREVGGLPDIGAYEFDPDSIFTTGFGP